MKSEKKKENIIEELKIKSDAKMSKQKPKRTVKWIRRRETGLKPGVDFLTRVFQTQSKRHGLDNLFKNLFIHSFPTVNYEQDA